MRLLKLDDIIPNSKQPRRTFYDNSLEELAQSIKERGVLEPIVVRPKDGKYEIVMGERRYRAVKLAGLEEIPAVIREMSDEDAAADALLENFQREDLNPVDRAMAIEELLNFMTWEQCAKTLGVSESTLRRHLELLDIPPFMQHELIESWDKSSQNSFTEAHARILRSINDDPGTQRRMVEKIKEESMTVTEVQRLLDAIKQMPGKKEAFLRVPLRVTEEILKQVNKSQKKTRPFKAQTADQQLAAFNKLAGSISDLIDIRLIEYLKFTEMNQLLNTCTSLAEELEEFSREIRLSLRRGDDGFKETYVYCPLCGRKELVGSLKCMVCCTILRRCLDCGHYDRMYQRCSLTQDYVYLAEAESPKEASKSFKCANYKPLYERKVA